MKRYKKYLHYYQFAQSIPISYRVERNAKRTKFHKVQPHYNFNFILTTCTSTSNVILMWKDSWLLHTIDSTKPLETCNCNISKSNSFSHFSACVYERGRPTTCWAKMLTPNSLETRAKKSEEMVNSTMFQRWHVRSTNIHGKCATYS